MGSDETLSEKIEREYQNYMANPDGGVDALYPLLVSYLNRVAAPIVREGRHVRQDALEDLVQDAVIYILDEGLTRFEKREAKFASWCAVIVKNRALDWVRRQSRHRLDILEEETTVSDLNRYGEGGGYLRNPEEIILDLERKLALCESVKCYLQLLVNMDEKPYRTVSCCFTMVLFHRYHKGSKELSSPSWAYGALRENTVEIGAEHFLHDMNSWMPYLRLRWGDAFLDGMDLQEDGCYVSDMVFGEHFKVKDFENWSRRIRERIKREFVQAEAEKSIGLEL